MKGSLAVAIDDGHEFRTVTRATRGLQFTKTAPGGNQSASCTLLLPRDAFRDLGPADRMFVYDTRTGRTVWDGYTENPGETDGDAGQSFELSAMGGMILASDRAERLPYLDRSMDGWRQADTLPQVPSGTGGQGDFPETAGTAAGLPAAFAQFNPGQPITTNSQVGAIYDAYKGSTMKLGGFAGFHDEGMSDPNYNLEWITWPKPVTMVGSVILASVPAAGAATAISRFAVADFEAGVIENLTFRLIRAAGGATNIATDTIWAGFGRIVMLGQLLDRYGAYRNMATASHIVTNPISGYILASEVAEDLLGRVLTNCDPTTAIIETSAAQIDQLAYTEAVTASAVFEELAQHEPDFLWEILETLPNGKHRFNFRAWPTTARYEISTRDGYNAPGGESDLCNRIAVDWTDQKGVKQTTVVTADVPELDAHNRVKDAESVELPEGRGSAANAQRIGELVLASKNNPPKAGTAQVGHPIMDHLRGALVMPWEIEPGYLVRVRETGDELRLTQVEYADEDVSATLTLGTPVRSVDELVADATRRVSA